MRRFHLVRREDLSGVSGTGVVAEGIEFDNGSAAMCWLTKYHIIEVVPNVHTLEAVHGHGGRTYVEWLDTDVVGVSGTKSHEKEIPD